MNAELAQKLLASWLDAQNRQDFAAYERLYTSGFRGVKRAGSSTKRFDREGWLRDRKGMFAHPFHVTAEAPSIRLVGETAVASFQQAYASERYSDKGPKQLELVLEAGEPRIAREEMLRSEVVAHPISSGELSIIRAVEMERRYWVIGGVSPAGVVVSSDPERVGDGAAFAKITPARDLPLELRPLIGAKVLIEPGTEQHCEAKLDDWGVLAHFEPSSSDHRRWGGMDGEPPVPDAQVAREVFGDNKVDETDHVFAVDITAATKDCESARWGRLASLPAAHTFAVEETTQPWLTPRLLSAIRKSPSFRALQKQFSESQSEGSLEELIAEQLQVYYTQVGKQAFLLTTFYYEEDCHGFKGELTHVWRVQNKAPVLLPTQVPRRFQPILALDLDGDGQPEWLSETELIGRTAAGYELVLDVTPHSYDDPC